MIKAALPAAALIVAFFALCGCQIATRPAQQWAAHPADRGLRYEDVVLMSSDGIRLHGWWLDTRGPARANVLLVHDAGVNIGDQLDRADAMVQAGLQVLLLDYRGYGLSEGDPELTGAVSDIQLGLDWLSQASAASGPTVALGDGLGAALLIEALPQTGGHACVVLARPFDRYENWRERPAQAGWLPPPRRLANRQQPWQGISALGDWSVLFQVPEGTDWPGRDAARALFKRTESPKQWGDMGTTGMLEFLDRQGCLAAIPEAARPQPVPPRPTPVEQSDTDERIDTPLSPSGGYRF